MLKVLWTMIIVAVVVTGTAFAESHGHKSGRSKAVRPVPLPVAGTVFRDHLKDGTQGPEMVVIPAGNYQMGAVHGGGDSDEKPVHRVTISRPFAIGRYEVTFEEYDRFCEYTGREKPKDGRRYFPFSNWGRGRRPVFNVTWDDAVAYALWLSEQTGYYYRLPSESEWEYAAGGGSEDRYWWGFNVGENRANCKGCGSQWDGKKTAPVGSFPPNRFGLYDTAGNVWEWCRDRWHESYDAAPTDGTAWEWGEDPRRVQRGGSFGSKPRYVRTSARGRGKPTERFVYLGFRVVRELKH